MRPEGIGRPGSLIASTWRSNQSLQAWLVPQTSGPASNTPDTMIGHRPEAGPAKDMTPQANAHIGANQVIGFKSSRTTLGLGSRIAAAVTAFSITRRLRRPRTNRPGHAGAVLHTGFVG
jgi:hypothetical protein